MLLMSFQAANTFEQYLMRLLCWLGRPIFEGCYVESLYSASYNLRRKHAGIFDQLAFKLLTWETIYYKSQTKILPAYLHCRS